MDRARRRCPALLYFLIGDFVLGVKHIGYNFGYNIAALGL
jgi:hypothetical protein